MSQDLVSVIIPCHNDAAWVGGAIDSALAQSHRPLEVVVVDDGSGDGSPEVIRGYGERVLSVRLEAQAGAAAARNRGIAASSGEWLTFLDADDYSDPDSVAALVEAARGSPGKVAVCPWQFEIWDGEVFVPTPPDRPYAPEGDPLEGWLRGHFAPPVAVLYPRALVVAAGGFDAQLRRNDDGDLAMRLFMGGTQLVRANGGCGHYRRHGTQSNRLTSDLRSRRALLSQLRVFMKLRVQLGQQGRLAQYQELIGTQLGHLALHAMSVGEFDIVRECLRAGGPAALRRVSSPTASGRLLEALLGIYLKNRFTYALRRLRQRLTWGAHAAADVPARPAR